MSDTTETTEVETEELILPHQEVLDDLREEGILDRSDLDHKTKSKLGTIENAFAKAVKNDDEDAQKVQMDKSKDLANVLLEFARQKREQQTLLNNFNILVEQADGLLKEGSRAQAKLLYEQALLITADDAHVQGQLAAIAEAEQEENTQAENQTNMENHMNAAMAFMEAGKLVEARSEYESALQYSPDDPKILQMITDIDIHLLESTNNAGDGVGAISGKKERLIEIMKDIQKHVSNRGQITHQDLIDIGITKYKTDADEWTIGKQDVHGQTITLVKVSDGVYKLKETPKKKTNWGAITAIVALAAAAIGIGVYVSKRKKG